MKLDHPAKFSAFQSAKVSVLTKVFHLNAFRMTAATGSTQMTQTMAMMTETTTRPRCLEASVLILSGIYCCTSFFLV